MTVNFTLQDILGTVLGFFLFPTILVSPGYVAGWIFNPLSFRKRRPVVRLGLGVLFSFSVSPIILFLCYRFFGYQFAFGVISALAIAFSTILIRTTGWTGKRLSTKSNTEFKHLQSVVFTIVIIWVAFSILFLSDWQFGNRLYNNSVSFDHTTRVSVIQAITRTGVPPVNPSYYPGHPEKLTFLYYFWYILASAIDQMGGEWVNARTAFNASIIWCGIGLMIAISFYIREREKTSGSTKALKTALFGIGSLLISGFDIFPTIALLLSSYTVTGHMALLLPGDLEHWNEQITAWLGSIVWVPHHVAAVIACLTGMMLLLWSFKQDKSHQLTAMFITGLGFASAFGMSVWVTIVFATFWVIWGLTLLFDVNRRPVVLSMLFAGVFALATISPFILDILSSSNPSGTNAAFPLMPGVRPFQPIQVFVSGHPEWLQSIIYLLALPFNYLMELGFFFLVGLLWIVIHPKAERRKNPYFRAEMILLTTTVFLVSFFRSTVIANNDFGWRGWLFGQFVLLIWGVDVIEFFWSKQVPRTLQIASSRYSTSRLKIYIQVFILIGMATTILDLGLLRVWSNLQDAELVGFPAEIISWQNIGHRTYDGRLAYEYIDTNTPDDAIIQFNPNIFLDRTAGLYRTRQAIISTHTLYGVPEEQYKQLTEEIGTVFEGKLSGSSEIYKYCQNYKINILVFSSMDPIWPQLEQLNLEKEAEYKNQNYAVFACNSSRH